MTDKTVSRIAMTKKLVDRPMRTYNNWSEWLMRWNEIEIYSELMGHLDHGYDVSCEIHKRPDGLTNLDRHVFYFKMADGWTDFDAFRKENENQALMIAGTEKDTGTTIMLRPFEMRRQIAAKAFDLLCLNLFEPWNRKHPSNFSWRIISRAEKTNWERQILKTEILDVLMRFFAPEPGPSLQAKVIRNLGPKHEIENQKHAVAFLENLAKLLWSWSEEDPDPLGSRSPDQKVVDNNKLIRSRIDLAMPWMIEVLAYLGKLEVIREFALDLDASCLKKLEEIAMRSFFDPEDGHPVLEARRILTVNEACLAGSETALFLQRCLIIQKEYSRLSAVLEKEKKVKKAEAELEELRAAN